ncbi:hypothetical protein CBL_11076 [Carabus blaptoides fortunei]
MCMHARVSLSSYLQAKYPVTSCSSSQTMQVTNEHAVANVNKNIVPQRNNTNYGRADSLQRYKIRSLRSQAFSLELLDCRIFVNTNCESTQCSSIVVFEEHYCFVHGNKSDFQITVGLAPTDDK